MKLHLGDALEVLKSLDSNSVDSIVTDPPYFLLNSNSKGFMNKEWDGISIQHVLAEIFFKSAKLELSMAGESIVQEYANTSLAKQINDCISSASSVLKNLDEANHTLNPHFSSAQIHVLTKVEALALCRELLPSLINHLEKLPDNASFVLQPLPTGITTNGTAQNAVDIYLGEPKWLEQITTFISTGNPKTSRNPIEERNGIGLEPKFTNETQTNAEDAISSAKELIDNAITSDHTACQKTIQKIISLPFVKAVTKQFTANQNFTQNILISWHERWAREAIRVLKPGSHGLAFSGARTYQYLALGLERAGFEIRDQCVWIYGQGFPKSLSVEKVLKKLGKEDEAKQWAGFGSALKPSHEPICLFRKPLAEKNIAENVLTWGTGGLNIDQSRIELNGQQNPSIARYKSTPQHGNNGWNHSNRGANFNPEQASLGRFPANLILSHHPDCEEICVDECAVQELDEHSGYLHPSGNKKSRFFYCSKASRKDRGEGNGHPTVKSTKLMEYLITLITPPGGVVMDCFMGSGSTGVAAKRLGFEFIGIEKEAEYFEIAKARCNS